MFVQVTFPISSFRTFTYSVPIKYQKMISVGSCVHAIMGNRKLTGYVVNIQKNTSFKGKIRPIDKIHESELNIPRELWKTLEWISKYYITPLGKTLKTAIPQSFMNSYSPKKIKYVNITKYGKDILENWSKKNAPNQLKILKFLNQNDELVPITSLSKIIKSPHNVCNILEANKWISSIEKRKVYDPFEIMRPGIPIEIKLSNEQNQVYQKIKKSLNKSIFKSFLLHGVTGSGKTEVYLKLAQDAVKLNRTVLVLVPEISLTPQVAKRFRKAFGERVALWHSKMTQAEKGWTWQELKKGTYSVVVGARSALFAPLNNLGLIIVDEEQEATYKQDSSSPKYNARDVALIRAKYSNSIVLLTSATPSVESYFNTLNKKLSILKLIKRFGNAVYPKVQLVDMKNHSNFDEENNIISDILYNAIKQRLNNNEQIILLQNRRGFSLIQQCEDCGNITSCKNCSISLTYHQNSEKLICHYCEFEIKLKNKCQECDSDNIKLKGSGTQKIESIVKNKFPDVRIIRMDIDTVQNRGAHQKLLKQFENGNAEILLGTQMIAKGLDFPNVTLVGVINADSSLFLPDFRSGERTFQLLYQVCGRAGRHLKPGEAIIQTWNPDDPYIKSASELDIKKFYNIALSQRQELQYPPFSRLSRILITGNNQLNVKNISIEIISRLKINNKSIEILGPTPAPIQKIRNLWRYHIIIKSIDSSPSNIHKLFHDRLDLNTLEKIYKGVKIAIDMDPISML